MEDIYKKNWELARPYYEKGRDMDVDHIVWMMKDAEIVCDQEGIDKTIFMPLVVLHDAGYSEVENPKDNAYKLDMRRAHMKAGAELAEKILESINYDPEKIKKIVYYISVHDNWAFEDNEIYLKDKLLGNFTDLDFIWMATAKGFPFFVTMRKTTPEEMFNYIANNDKLAKRPFSSATTKKLFEDYMSNLESELK